MKCEILYIGKANDLKTRMDGHAHIQQAQAECADHEEIYLYFFTPKFDAIDVSERHIDIQPNDLHKLTEEEKILICEAGLINYFKPNLNIIHKDSDITQSITLEKLRINSYTHFMMHCMFDEEDYSFETETVTRNKHHGKIYRII